MLSFTFPTLIWSSLHKLVIRNGGWLLPLFWDFWSYGFFSHDFGYYICSIFDLDGVLFSLLHAYNHNVNFVKLNFYFFLLALKVVLWISFFDSSNLYTLALVFIFIGFQRFQISCNLILTIECNYWLSSF